MHLPIAVWLVKNRLILFLISLVLIAISCYGGLSITIKSDYKIFFEKNNPQLIENEHIQDTFSASDNVLLVLNPKDGNIFTHENLAAIESLTQEAWSTPFSQRVDSLTNFQNTFVDGDELLVEDLVSDAENLSGEELSLRRSIAINEPLLVHRLISPSGHVSAINIQLALPDDQTAAIPKVMSYIREVRDQFERDHPNFNVMITGMAPLNNAFNEMSQKDSETLVPIMLVVILVLVGLLLRSPSSIAIVLIVITLSVVTSVCMMGWMKIPINNINSAAPIVILTLAVADCIHILTHFLMGMRKGLDKLEALTQTLDFNIKPVFLTSLTTAIGFLSMLSSESPPFRELGVVSAIGVAVAFILSLTVMPQLMMWLTRKAPNIDAERTQLFSGLAEFTIRHPKKLFYGTLIVSLVCISFISENELNDDNFGYFSKNLEVRQAADFTEANLNGVNIIEYSLDSGQPNGINNPDFLAKVEAFVEWYRQQPHVTHVFSFTDTLKRLNQNMHGDDKQFYHLPESQELASQYQLLYEMSLPFGMDLNNQVDLNKSKLRITASIKGVKAKQILELEHHAQQWFEQHAPELKTVGASPSIMFSTIGQRNIDSMLKGTVLATLIISAILIVSLGSWKLGVLSIIPNAFPAAITLGIWGFLVGEVNLAVAVVFGVTLGIVVDDTVHFMSKYLRGLEVSGGDINKAIHYSFEHVGAALVTTTIVLTLGFGMLALSDFNVNATLGIMVASTILIALIFDFLFLPTMMIHFRKFLNPKSDTKPKFANAVQSESN